MNLSPLDIRKHEFSKSFRGYNPEEVRPFLEMVSQQWEELTDELRHAKDRVREMENKLVHYEKVEVALQEALEAARSNAARTQAHAEERARLSIDEAELKAEQIVREAEQERFRLRQDISKLTHRHAEVSARLRHFLMTELEVLAQHENERPTGFIKLARSRDADALLEGLSDEGSAYSEQDAQSGQGVTPETESAESNKESSFTLRSVMDDGATHEMEAAQEASVVSEESAPTHKDHIRRILDSLD